MIKVTHLLDAGQKLSQRSDTATPETERLERHIKAEILKHAELKLIQNDLSPFLLKRTTIPMLDLSNKVLLLTGIGAVGEGWGNGTTMATLFARQGAKVFGCDINVDAANKAARTIRDDDEVKAHPCRNAGQDVVNVMQEPIVNFHRLFGVK